MFILAIHSNRPRQETVSVPKHSFKLKNWTTVIETLVDAKKGLAF